MASRTETGTRSTVASNLWVSATVAGLAAGVAMGILEWVEGALPLIGALYGVPSVTAGGIAHLFHSVVLALIFAAIVSRGPFQEYARKLSTSTALGVGYGVVLTIVTGGIVLPLWLMAIGFPNAPSVPSLSLVGLLNHLVYGVVLGAVYPMVRRR